MKKKVVAILTALMLSALPISVFGEVSFLCANEIVKDGTAMVCVKSCSVFKKLGFSVILESAEAYTISDGIHTIAITENSPTIKVDGSNITINVKPELIDGELYVPVAPIIRAIGGSVEWIAESKAIVINYNGKRIKIVANPNSYCNAWVHSLSVEAAKAYKNQLMSAPKTIASHGDNLNLEYYALYDIDKDGTDELLVQYINQGYKYEDIGSVGRISTVYTYKNGNIIDCGNVNECGFYGLPWMEYSIGNGIFFYAVREDPHGHNRVSLKENKLVVENESVDVHSTGVFMASVDEYKEEWGLPEYDFSIDGEYDRAKNDFNQKFPRIELYNIGDNSPF